MVRFKNGSWINLSFSNLDTNPKPGYVEVHGTKGNYVIDWDGYHLYRKDDGESTEEKGPHHDSTPHKYYENIVGHLTGQQPLVITAEWARRPIQVLDLAVKSAKLGKTLLANDRREAEVQGLAEGLAAEMGIHPAGA